VQYERQVEQFTAIAMGNRLTLKYIQVIPDKRTIIDHLLMFDQVHVPRALYLNVRAPKGLCTNKTCTKKWVRERYQLK